VTGKVSNWLEIFTWLASELGYQIGYYLGYLKWASNETIWQYLWKTNHFMSSHHP